MTRPQSIHCDQCVEIELH